MNKESALIETKPYYELTHTESIPSKAVRNKYKQKGVQINNQIYAILGHVLKLKRLSITSGEDRIRTDDLPDASATL